MSISKLFETITLFFLAKKAKKIVQFVRFFIRHVFSWASPKRDPAQSGHTEFYFEGLFLFTYGGGIYYKLSHQSLDQASKVVHTENHEGIHEKDIHNRYQTRTPHV